MRWNTPLSDEHAALLLERLDIVGGQEILDLGCGWGELLLRAIAHRAATTGIGVDSDTWAIERGRDEATKRGLSERVSFVTGNASSWTSQADRVICIGASHAWGGSAEALQALSTVVCPGARILFGDGCWEQPPPSEAAAAIFGHEILTLSDLVEDAMAVGWRVIHMSTADQREWDDFEATWRAGRQEWLLAHPQDNRAGRVRHKLDRQVREYVGSYRGVLGFTYLVLSLSQ
jgi:cyclopropane fatty-acyl-phospholipid synthase-like methyltransferase